MRATKLDGKGQLMKFNPSKERNKILLKNMNLSWWNSKTNCKIKNKQDLNQSKFLTTTTISQILIKYLRISSIKTNA